MTYWCPTFERPPNVIFIPGCSLKVHCHYNPAVFWSKLLKYLTKNLFSNMKLLLEHREENIKVFLLGRTNYNQFLATSLKYTGRT